MLLTLYHKYFLKLAVLFLFFGAHVCSAQSTLKLVNHSWPPYSGKNLLNQGLAIDIATTALHRSGYSTQFQLAPWKRALLGTIEGHYDILITTSYSQKRSEKVLYSEPFLTHKVSFIQRSGSDHTFKNLTDLNGLTVGVIDGYIYEPNFDKANNFVKEKTDSDALALKMLIAGRIDLVIIDNLVAAYTLKQEISIDTQDVEILPNPLNVKKLYIIIRKTKIGHEKIISDFNQSLLEMRSDGTYAEILKKHLNNLK